MPRCPRSLLTLLTFALAGCSIGQNTPGIGGGVGDVRPVGFVYSTIYAKNAVLEIDNVQSRAQQDPILVSNGPRSLTIDPRGRGEYLYVVCELGNTVDVVDRRNRRTIRNINTGRQPYAMAITPNGARGFITNQGDDTVTVVDMRTQTVMQNLHLTATATSQPGTLPQAVALKPRGIVCNASGQKVYVACAGGYVAILEGNPGTLTPVTGGGELTGPTTTPSGQLYSATRVQQLVGSISPQSIAINSTTAEGDFVYITDPQSNQVFYFNGNQVQAPQVQQIQGSPWGVAVGKNPATGKADKLYVTLDAGNGLATFDLPNLGSGGQPASVEGRNPQNVTVSSIGDEIYVALTGSNNIGVFKRVGTGLSRPEVYNLQQLNPAYIAPTGDIALGGFLGN